MNGMTRRSHIGMEKLRQVRRVLQRVQRCPQLDSSSKSSSLKQSQVYLTPADETIPDDDDAHNCKVIVQQILAVTKLFTALASSAVPTIHGDLTSYGVTMC